MPRSNKNRFVAAARAWVCLLAGALLIFELLAANTGLHRALHQTEKAGSNSCVLCLLAKGQVDQPDSVSVSTDYVHSTFALPPELESVLWVDFAFLTSPSRAPPCPAPTLWVLA